MPEGSSSDAPVMRPGPSSLRIRLTGFFSPAGAASKDPVPSIGSECGNDLHPTHLPAHLLFGDHPLGFFPILCRSFQWSDVRTVPATFMTQYISFGSQP